MSKKLVEVRDKFSETLNDPRNLNASTREIATTFFIRHRSSIASEAWDEVTISGLVHMMGGLRKKRPPPTSQDQGLFAGFDIEPIVVVRVAEEGKGLVEKNKGRASITLPEAIDYLERHMKERDANVKMIREWRRLIARVKPFMTRAGMTIEEGLRAAAAANEAKTKKRS
jgi:hypothetical protein